MRAARALAAAVAAACLGSGAAAAGDPVQTAGRAAKLCGEGDLADAAAELRGLLTALEAELGPANAAPTIVRMNLAPLERALGNEEAARALEAPPSGGGDPKAPLDPKLKRALRGLAVCATAEAPPILAEIPPDQQLEVALTLYNQGQYRKALDNAELARETAGPDAPASLVKRIYHTVALIQLQLGDNDDALAAAETAEKLARQENDAELRIALARLVAQAGDLERAITALDEIEKGKLSDLARAELLEARGDVALRLGSPKDALAALDGALAGHRAAFGPDHPSTAAVHHLRGDAFRMAGDFPSASSEYREALRVRQKALGRNHAETARTQNAIGVLQADLRDWRSADAAFEAALASLDESLGPDHPETLTIRANRALARWGATRDCAASVDYAGAMEALSGALGADHPSVSAAALNLARIEFECGHPDRADALLARALAAQRARLGPNHPVLAATRLQRGKLLAYRGQLQAAAAEMDGALAILVAQLGSSHPVVARARTARSRVATASGDPKTALSQALQASEALALFTKRTFGAISDRQRALLAQDSQDVIGALLSVEGAPPRELYVSLLPHRDSVLRSIAASRAAAREGHGAYTGQLEQLRRRYVATVLGRGPDTAERVKEIASAIEGLESMAGSAGARMADVPPDRALSLACERLPKDAALVKFVAYDRTVPGRGGGTVPAYAALVVRGGSCAVTRISLGDGDAIAKSAESFATAMREQRTDAPEDRAALSRLLLAPLAQAVAGTSGWLVIPDGSLWGVPVGALPDPESPDHYLLERVTVGYLTSTYELAERKPSDAGKDELSRSLLIGAPDFGSSERGGPVVLTSTGPCQIQPFEKLPATRKELEDIAEIIPKPHMLLGGEATKPLLERALTSDPWLVHFATHAYFAGLGGCGGESSDGGDDVFEEQARPVAANPLLLSGIVMAGANNPTRVDAEVESGILTAYEVAGLDLGSAGLVVLSACDTGTGLHLRGQEVQGLRWGFRAAGAHALVTSLWRSNDAATRRMMKSFYEALVSRDLRGDALRGAEALQRAQREQLEGEQRLGVRRPLLWANFIFSGVL